MTNTTSLATTESIANSTKQSPVKLTGSTILTSVSASAFAAEFEAKGTKLGSTANTQPAITSHNSTTTTTTITNFNKDNLVKHTKIASSLLTSSFYFFTAFTTRTTASVRSSNSSSNENENGGRQTSTASSSTFSNATISLITNFPTTITPSPSTITTLINTKYSNTNGSAASNIVGLTEKTANVKSGNDNQTVVFSNETAETGPTPVAEYNHTSKTNSNFQNYMNANSKKVTGFSETNLVATESVSNETGLTNNKITYNKSAGSKNSSQSKINSNNLEYYLGSSSQTTILITDPFSFLSTSIDTNSPINTTTTASTNTNTYNTDTYLSTASFLLLNIINSTQHASTNISSTHNVNSSSSTIASYLLAKNLTSVNFLNHFLVFKSFRNKIRNNVSQFAKPRLSKLTHIKSDSLNPTTFMPDQSVSTTIRVNKNTIEQFAEQNQQQDSITIQSTNLSESATQVASQFSVKYFHHRFTPHSRLNHEQKNVSTVFATEFDDVNSYLKSIQGKK